MSFDGSTLRLAAPSAGLVDLPLAQSSGNVFTATIDGETEDITFVPGASGEAKWLVTRTGVATRVAR